MTKQFKETDDGMFEWVDAGHGAGYWRKIEDSFITQFRTPERCPACSAGLDNWAIEKFYHRNGVCADCSICFLDGRNFPEGHFKTRNDKVEWCKQKIAEKSQNK